MFLADAAAAALEAEQRATAAAARRHEADLVTAARTHLTRVLGEDATVSALVDEHIDTTEALVVLTDGRVFLAVTRAEGPDAEVWLVTADDDAQVWVRVAPITSLANLGELLADGAA